ncbi:hypothetical protein [Maricaulis sp.]|uniref:hypothetical protein n=1 Tax=Maricaulis sp. TaxID=1486257 RepID=UPI00262F05EE|nr:hypothetical protein [Maricaulis sp.]
MLSELEICLENRLCTWRISGSATVQEICDGYAERFSHPDWEPGLQSLTVLNKLALGNFTPDSAVEIMRFIRDCDIAHNHIGKRGALVCSDSLSQALLTYWQHRGSAEMDRSERAFATEAEALAWLRRARYEDSQAA